MAAPANPKVSAEHYLEIERLAEYKNEFLYGQILAMSGGSPNHAAITANLTIAFGPKVDQKGCRAFSSDLKVGIEGSVYFYPDLSIVCGDLDLLTSKQDVLANPTVVIEVLSPSTEAYDRGTKFHAYRQFESLKQYVLVSQSSRSVDILTRQGAVWVIETVTGSDQLHLDSLGVAVSLDEIYNRVSFEPLP